MAARRFVRDFRYTLTMAGILIAVIALGFLSTSAAKHSAEEQASEAGLTSVKSDAHLFSWCPKNYVGVTVTGERDGETVHLKYCASWLHTYQR